MTSEEGGRGGERRGGGVRERERRFQDYWGYVVRNVLEKFRESSITCVKFYTRRVVTGK